MMMSLKKRKLKFKPRIKQKKNTSFTYPFDLFMVNNES